MEPAYSLRHRSRSTSASPRAASPGIHGRSPSPTAATASPLQVQWREMRPLSPRSAAASRRVALSPSFSHMRPTRGNATAYLPADEHAVYGLRQRRELDWSVAPSHTTFHSSQRDTRGSRSLKTYLVATYTARLEQADVDEHFVFDPHQPDQVAAATRDGLQLGGAARIAGWSDQGSSPRTDASVWVELHGRTRTGLGGVTTSSGRRQLARRGGARLSAATAEWDDHSGGGGSLFSPGHIDEFALTCEDLGDIQTCTIGHENDGLDSNTSAWKLEKVVVTCIQHSKDMSYAVAPISRPASKMRRSVFCCGSRTGPTEAAVSTGKGDHAHASVKTVDSAQWHFVYRGWLRCERPLLEISTIAKKIADAQERLEEWKLERRKLEVDVLHWQEQLMAAQERPADYTRTRVKIGITTGTSNSGDTEFVGARP